MFLYYKSLFDINKIDKHIIIINIDFIYKYQTFFKSKISHILNQIEF